MSTLAAGLRVLAETTKFTDGDALTGGKIRAYELALEGIPLASLELGLKSLFKRAIWFPTAAEIREACRQESQHRQLEIETKARLELPAKPPGWAPLKLEEAPEFKQALVKLRMPATAPVAQRRVIVPLTEEQHNARLAELRRQAELLGATK
jgi:hypothetical protein